MPEVNVNGINGGAWGQTRITLALDMDVQEVRGQVAQCTELKGSE